MPQVSFPNTKEMETFFEGWDVNVFKQYKKNNGILLVEFFYRIKHFFLSTGWENLERNGLREGKKDLVMEG